MNIWQNFGHQKYFILHACACLHICEVKPKSLVKRQAYFTDLSVGASVSHITEQHIVQISKGKEAVGPDWEIFESFRQQICFQK